MDFNVGQVEINMWCTCVTRMLNILLIAIVHQNIKTFKTKTNVYLLVAYNYEFAEDTQHTTTVWWILKRVGGEE